jgi:hypothetical protein
MIYSIFCIVLILGPMGIEWTSLPTGQISVECAGDVNGDGTEDCFTASSEYNGSGVFCLDGLTGEILWQNDSIPGVWLTESFRTIGDVNLDGTLDVAAGTGITPFITVFSGADGSILWSLPQEHSVAYVDKSEGPNPGDAVVLVLGNYGSDWCYFYGLNGQTGEPVWSDPYVVSTLDTWMKVTDVDVNFNGWSEMGISVDRGSVMSGFVSVRDGYTGEHIYGCGTCYFPTMDISDSPIPCLAVAHFGWEPDIWVDNLLVGITVWSNEEADFLSPNLKYIPNISGPSYPYPELIAWGASEATLIMGNQGNYEDSYEFPSDIVTLDVFQDAEDWKLVALTETDIHCPILTLTNPQTEPSIQLPSSLPTDFCILESDQFPTPIVCVSMDGSSPGVCAVRTSWQVHTEENVSLPVSDNALIRLSSSPCVGGIGIACESYVEIYLVDISGRIVTSISMSEGEEIFLETPPGVYLLFDRNTNTILQKAIVLD